MNPYLGLYWAPRGQSEDVPQYAELLFRSLTAISEHLPILWRRAASRRPASRSGAHMEEMTPEHVASSLSETDQLPRRSSSENC